jgi:GT2 family glycosyltransferase
MSAKFLDAECDIDAEVPVVSVVIVNFNGLRFLRACLESLRKALLGISHEIIIVDNASADGSGDFLTTEFPDVHLILSDKNLGFTGGNNLGAKFAKGRLLLLLNNDTECKSHLGPLIDGFSDPQVGAAGCLLRYGDGRLQASVGYEHTPSRIVFSWVGLSRFFRRTTLFSRVQYNPAFYAQNHHNLAWISGACLLTSTDIWRQLGGFDEQFFMYCEDVDYCRRVRQLDFRIVFSPHSEVTHYEGAGKAWIGELALLRTVRSYLIYVNKHFGRQSRFFVGVLLSVVFLSRSLAYCIMRFFSPRNIVISQKLRAYSRAGVYLITRGLGFRGLETKI